MAKPGMVNLHNGALNALLKRGYKEIPEVLPGLQSDNVHRLEKNGEKAWFLVQARHEQHDLTRRYLVGLSLSALERADQVAIYFENELEEMFIIPASFIRDIYEKTKALGQTAYTKDQWRVNFYLGPEDLSPQGSNGQRYSISAYRVSSST